MSREVICESNFWHSGKENGAAPTSSFTPLRGKGGGGGKEAREGFGAGGIRARARGGGIKVGSATLVLPLTGSIAFPGAEGGDGGTVELCRGPRRVRFNKNKNFCFPKLESWTTK